MVDELRHAAHPGGYRGLAPYRPLREGVGEGRGKAGEGVHVQGAVKAVRIRDPAQEVDPVRHPQAPGQGFELPLLRPVPGDEQAAAAAALLGQGEAPDEGVHVLHGVQAGGDAVIHGPRLLRHPVGLQEFAPAQGLPGPGEVHAVVYRIDPVRLGHPPGDEQLAHGVADAGEVVHPPQGHAVQQPEAHGRQGPAHVVQPPVAVNGAEQGQAGGALQQPGHDVAPAAVAVDEVEAPLLHHPPELRQHGPQVPAVQDRDVDAHVPGRLGEFRLHEAHQLHVDPLPQFPQQPQHVGLCAAHVPAADERQDLHVPLSHLCVVTISIPRRRAVGKRGSVPGGPPPCICLSCGPGAACRMQGTVSPVSVQPGRAPEASKAQRYTRHSPPMILLSSTRAPPFLCTHILRFRRKKSPANGSIP